MDIEDILGVFSKPLENCKHEPDLTKNPVVCKKCGVRMEIKKP